ncbi:MAG: hypothetical protein ACYSYV_06525 [Planctomycetota bacterium]|jgi:hypothetical protein
MLENPYKKTDRFKIAVFLFCGAVFLWTLGPWAVFSAPDSRYTPAPRYGSPIMFAQGRGQPDSAEQASERDVSDEDAWMVRRPIDYVWITCAVVVTVLLFVRTIILFACGYGIRCCYDWGYDQRLREIARRQGSERRRLLLNLINILIPVLFISGALMLLLWRTAPTVLRGLYRHWLLPAVRGQ